MTAESPPNPGETLRPLGKAPARRLVLAAILLTLGAAAIALPSQVALYTGQQALSARGAELIDASLERTENTFLALSTIKAGIALLEGSTVGIGVEIQVGDLTQPAYDYIDFFWRVFLYALVVLASYKILLDTGMLELGILLFGIGAILYAIGLLTPPRETVAPSIGRRCMLLGILVAYLAPASLLVTQSLSERYTADLKEVHYDSIAEFQAELDTAKEEFLQLRERISVLSPSQSIQDMRDSFVRIAGSVAESFRLSLMAFLYYSLLIVFDLLFFPFVSAWLLYKVAQAAFDRALQPPAAIPAGPVEA